MGPQSIDEAPGAAEDVVVGLLGRWLELPRVCGTRTGSRPFSPPAPPAWPRWERGTARSAPASSIPGLRCRSEDVSADGVGEAIGPNATGYTMVQAESLEAATTLARGCRLLKHGRMVTVIGTLPM